MIIDDSQDFGCAVRNERRRLGFSQESLAAAAGVGARFVVELEQGKPSAQIDKALAVARALGLTIAVTATGETDG